MLFSIPGVTMRMGTSMTPFQKPSVLVRTQTLNGEYMGVLLERL